jgi:hypothetical protein
MPTYGNEGSREQGVAAGSSREKWAEGTGRSRKQGVAGNRE